MTAADCIPIRLKAYIERHLISLLCAGCFVFGAYTGATLSHIFGCQVQEGHAQEVYQWSDREALGKAVDSSTDKALDYWAASATADQNAAFEARMIPAITDPVEMRDGLVKVRSELVRLVESNHVLLEELDRKIETLDTEIAAASPEEGEGE